MLIWLLIGIFDEKDLSQAPTLALSFAVPRLAQLFVVIIAHPRMHTRHMSAQLAMRCKTCVAARLLTFNWQVFFWQSCDRLNNFNILSTMLRNRGLRGWILGRDFLRYIVTFLPNMQLMVLE